MPTQQPSENPSSREPDRLRRSAPFRPPRPAELVLTGALDRARRAARICARGAIRAAGGSPTPVLSRTDRRSTCEQHEGGLEGHRASQKPCLLFL